MCHCRPWQEVITIPHRIASLIDTHFEFLAAAGSISCRQPSLTGDHVCDPSDIHRKSTKRCCLRKTPQYVWSPRHILILLLIQPFLSPHFEASDFHSIIIYFYLYVVRGWKKARFNTTTDSEGSNDILSPSLPLPMNLAMRGLGAHSVVVCFASQGVFCTRVLFLKVCRRIFIRHAAGSRWFPAQYLSANAMDHPSLVHWGARETVTSKRPHA